MAASASSSGQPLPCPAWIVSNNSNCHVAKDRAWFGDDYRSISSHVGSIYFDGPASRVIGLGTVLLPTKTHPNRRGPSSHGTLRLEHVLHVPTATCNVIGNPIFADHDVDMFTPGGGIRETTTKRQVAHFKRGPLFLEIRLSGPPIGPRLGPSPFDLEASYVINFCWPPAERAKFSGLAVGDAPRLGQSTAETPAMGEARFSEAEKKWLKDNYGGEFRFLRDHGLSIYKEEDREEGRAILRVMMRPEEHDLVWEFAKAMRMSGMVGLGMTNDDSDDDDGGDDILRQISPADYAFTDKQLDWIRAEYGNSETFMLSHGLKFYKDEDVEEAQAIAAVMMDDSGDDDGDGSEFDPEGHFADHAFTEKQLDWIEKEFGNSMTFMLAHGLKFYDDDDIKEARAIADRLVR
ncbi:hypothetical protein MN608_11286 [Microdochium nivale]|nr:hypothetical protein MN608_11286 [Microdochium nivale]